MWKSRLCYLFVLLGTTTFLICFDGYLSLYVFVLSLLLPVVSLVCSLPGMLCTRVKLSTGKGSHAPAAGKYARKGESIPLQLEVWNASPFSSGRVWVKLTVENTFTGHREQEGFSFTTGPQHQVFQHQLSSKTCGQVVCRLGKARVCDYLGLFSLPVGRPQQATAYFWPTVYSLELGLRESAVPNSEGEHYSQKKPEDDPSELFALREWREGDRLSRVHWKLSQKLGRPLVKELGLPLTDHLLFLLDLNGSGQECDLLLDAFASLSSFLAEREWAHRVVYWSAKAQQLQCLELAGQEDLLPLWQELLAAGCPAPLPSLEDEALPPGISHGLYLCRKPQGPIAGALEARYPAAHFTLLRTSSQGDASPWGRQIVLQPGQIQKALNGLTL